MKFFLLFSFLFLFRQRRLGDAAKKAISKLQVRTIKKGDEVRDEGGGEALFIYALLLFMVCVAFQETESDFDNCAVCIEGYRPNDVVRILPCR